MNINPPFFKIKYSIVLLLVITLWACNKERVFEEKPKEYLQIDWSKTKGYILRDQGLRILKKLDLRSPDHRTWKILHANDTIGKYIKSPETDHYIFCIWNPQVEIDSSAHYLIEVKHLRENKFEVIAKEKYVHGNTVGCWNNHFDGLQRHYDYFTFQLCHGKKGYSAVEHYYFTYVIPQKELTPITDKIARTNEKGVRLLASKKEFEPQNVKYFYRFESFQWENEKKIKETQIDTFTINYSLSGSLWLADTDKHWNKLK